MPLSRTQQRRRTRSSCPLRGVTPASGRAEIPTSTVPLGVTLHGVAQQIDENLAKPGDIPGNVNGDRFVYRPEKLQALLLSGHPNQVEGLFKGLEIEKPALPNRSCRLRS